MRTRLSAVVAAVALTTARGATAATGGPGACVAIPALDSADGAQHVTVVVGNSMHVAPQSLVVRAGQPAELTLRNGGGIPHVFALAGLSKVVAPDYAEQIRGLVQGFVQGSAGASDGPSSFLVPQTRV